MKLIIQSLLSGVFITIIVFNIVFIVDVNNNTGSASGISLVERTPFAWVFLWSDFFLVNEVGSDAKWNWAIASNIALYSILSYIFLRQRKKKNN